MLKLVFPTITYLFNTTKFPEPNAEHDIKIEPKLRRSGY